MTGQVFGAAGAGVANGAAWAANAGVQKVGAAAERKTGALLDRLARELNCTVLHDLMIPLSGYTANIDHVVVSGRHVLVVDSKAWKSGFYWTLGGKSYRGFSRFASTNKAGAVSYPAEKKTMQMAVDALVRNGLDRDQFALPLVAVWATGETAGSFWALKVPGARTIKGEALEGEVRRFARHGLGDPGTVASLRRLLVTPGRR